jgi:hypothetical protein
MSSIAPMGVCNALIAEIPQDVFALNVECQG